jgi:hypothetical protein
MISLGTATLFDDLGEHRVSLAITWEREHAWSGVLGGRLEWSDLVGRSLELDVPGSLAPADEPVVTDVVIDAVFENGNEVRARGTILGPATRSERLSSLSRG